MIRTAEDLPQELLAVDESPRIEAKRAPQIDRAVMETVVAFSNEPGLGGGHLLPGVERDPDDLFGTSYRVPGVTVADKLQSDLASQCAGSETRNPRIAAVLHGLNVAETKGSGIRAMRELMQQHDLLLAFTIPSMEKHPDQRYVNPCAPPRAPIQAMAPGPASPGRGA